MACDQFLANRAECASDLGACCCGCGPCACSGCYSEVYFPVALDQLGFNSFLGGLCFFAVVSYADALKKKGWKLLDLKKAIAVMTLSGGGVYVKPSSYKYCVRYYGKDLVLHDFFGDLVRHAYDFKVEPARCKMRGSYVTQIYRKELVQDLLSFSPSYTTRNNTEQHNGYAYGNTASPTAAFLLDSSYEVMREAVRLASSANGCVRYTVENQHNSSGHYFIRPQFCFGYLSGHPLLGDYRRILKKVGIETFPVPDRRYGMRGYLVGKSWRTVETFAKMGGFIDGVKIHHGNHRGLERNALLHALISFRRNEENRFETKENAIETLQKHL